MAAAMSPPIMGAIQNSQSWLRAVPPTMTAGPRLLAGFTDVPVIGMPTRWMRTRLKPIGIPAKPFGTFSLVEPKITRRKMKVNATSAMNPEAIGNPPGEAAPYPFCPKPSAEMLYADFPAAIT